MKKKNLAAPIYSAPTISDCSLECSFIYAASPTGESFTEPEEYDGF